MNFSDIIKEMNDLTDNVGEKICDELKGDCHKCPFNSKCIASTLSNLTLDLESLKDIIKETL